MLTMNLKGHSAFIKKKLFSDCKKEKKKVRENKNVIEKLGGTQLL